MKNVDEKTLSLGWMDVLKVKIAQNWETGSLATKIRKNGRMSDHFFISVICRKNPTQYVFGSLITIPGSVFRKTQSLSKKLQILVIKN